LKIAKKEIKEMKKGIKLIDNSSNEYQLGSVLKELIQDKSYSQISIATGYWDLPGMVDNI
jgi:hypothetical protein